jgi:hypothetical protein
MTRKRTNPIPGERCDLATNPASRRAATELAASVKDGFPPGISQPALRALASAGYSQLEQLCTISETELGKLHGMGPRAIEVLRMSLKQRGKSFRTSSAI